MLPVVADISDEVVGVQHASLVGLERVDGDPVVLVEMPADGPLVPRGGQLGELAHGDVALAARDHDLGPVEGDRHLHLVEFVAASRFTVSECGEIARRS